MKEIALTEGFAATMEWLLYAACCLAVKIYCAVSEQGVEGIFLKL